MLSEEKGTELWDKLEWLALTEENVVNRSDIAALLLYRDGFDTVNPLYLFWELYRPIYLDKSKSPAPHLPLKAENLILQILEDLQERYTIPYQPDGDSDIEEFFKANPFDAYPDEITPPDNLISLIILIHVAAARAFIIKRTSSLSEEFLDCLDIVETTWLRLRSAGHMPGQSEHEIFRSTDAISGLILLERSLYAQSAGNYAEALHELADSARRYREGTACDGAEGWWIEGSEGESPDPLLNDFWDFMTGMHAPLEGCLDAFRKLKNTPTGNDTDWRRIKNDCLSLADLPLICFPKDADYFKRQSADEWEGDFTYNNIETVSWHLGNHERIYDEIDGQGDFANWGEFWRSAATWASAQLGPSEYRRMREQDEKDAAASRLKTYFFRDTWDTLPLQAQKRLITADVNWNSMQQMSREAILNDLRRATEATCYRFIWCPLANDGKKRSLAFLEFRKIEAKIAEHSIRTTPRLYDYRRILQRPFFKEFAEQHNLSRDETRFLIETLPAMVEQLIPDRDVAEHEIEPLVPLSKIQSYYEAFLGIGRCGILPELARIGRKLQPGPT